MQRPIHNSCAWIPGLGAEMLNAVYQIMHKDEGNPARNYCHSQVRKVLDDHIPYLDSEVVYLPTPEDMDEFLRRTPQFKVNRIENYIWTGNVFPHKSGVVGVWASNYLAYKKFLETDKDVLLIFENDVIVSNNIIDVLEVYMNDLMDGWDFFGFNTPGDDYPNYLPNDYDYGSSYVCLSYQTWSCAGYAVSRKGAELAVADVEAHGISAPIDWYVFNFPHLGWMPSDFKTHCVKPSAYKPVKFFLPAATTSAIDHDSANLS